MKIFVLEDDPECNGVIEWLQDKTDTIKIARTIEDASYYLEYEDSYRNYDKFLLDASLPAASVLHQDGCTKDYYGSYNGIDFMMDNFSTLEIDIRNVAILTAYAPQVKKYIDSKFSHWSIKIIYKNDNDLTKQLQDFLNS